MKPECKAGLDWYFNRGNKLNFKVTLKNLSVIYNIGWLSLIFIHSIYQSSFRTSLISNFRHFCVKVLLNFLCPVSTFTRKFSTHCVHFHAKNESGFHYFNDRSSLYVKSAPHDKSNSFLLCTFFPITHRFNQAVRIEKMIQF